MAGDSLPSTYKRLMLMEAGESVESARIQVCETTMPTTLKMDEVLVKVAASPVNPSDYGAWQGEKKEPRPIGNEGSGVVVRVGSSVAAGLSGIRVGTKVGFTGLKRGQGAYSQYVVAPLATTFAMDSSLPVEDAASFFVNPFTAVGILETAKGKPFVHTAAASQLGQMLVKLAAKEGGPEIINVVRTEKQAQTLYGLGAKTVVVLPDPSDKNDEATTGPLSEAIEKAGAKLAFDAVAGKMTGLLVSILPQKSTVYVYGRLDGDVSNLAPIDLIYRQKQVKGWYLKSFLMGDGPITSARRLSLCSGKVRSGLSGESGWCKTSFVDCDTQTFWEKFIDMKNTTGFTDKKLRIRFDEDSREKSTKEEEQK